MGSKINFGTLACEPKIQKEVFSSAAEIEYRDINTLLKAGLVENIIQAGFYAPEPKKN